MATIIILVFVVYRLVHFVLNERQICYTCGRVMLWKGFHTWKCKHCNKIIKYILV